MSVPKYSEFYDAFLESLKDGELHAYNDCKDYVKVKMNLSDADLSEITASGYALWVNRLGWCTTYLKKAGLVISPKRSFFQITDEGKKLLKEGLHITDTLLSDRFPSFADFKKGAKPTASEAKVDSCDVPDVQETPQDTLERVYREINTQLAEDLLLAVYSMTPASFERLVVILMEGMGYGGYAGAGFVTKASGDDGIDGIIYEDKLGFNLIYIQAKKWAPERTIGKPEIQKFVGALMGPPKIDKGLYITTAKFSKGAEEYASAQHVILVDGNKLTNLMIEFGVGVSKQKIYDLKRIDSDFFDEL